MYFFDCRSEFMSADKSFEMFQRCISRKGLQYEQTSVGVVPGRVHV